jgi:hypothetical protein
MRIDYFFVRFCCSGIVHTRFLGLLQLKDFTAVGIHSDVSSFFRSHNLFHKLMFICTDGAPVMKSTNEGLAGLLIQLDPYLLSFHCVSAWFLILEQSLFICSGGLFVSLRKPKACIGPL